MAKYKTSKFDKQWALEQLLLIIKENNYSNISKKEFMAKKYVPSYSWYANHFGSFANALSELGYYTCYDKLIHKSEAIEILKDEYFKNNEKLSHNDMKKSSRISTPYIYYKIFNTKSWSEVLIQCGLNESCITFSKEQEEFIQNNYQYMRDDEIASHLGLRESQVQEKRRRMGLYIPKNLTKKSGSKWDDFDDEYFINKIYEFVNIHNRAPNKDDYELLSQINAPGISVYQSRFGKGFQTILGDFGYGYHRTPFTKEDEDFINKNYKTMSDLEMANYLGRTDSAIKTKRRLMGCLVSENKSYKFTEKEIEEIKKMFDDGVELKEIANKFNTTEAALIYRYERFGLKNRSNPWTDVELKTLRQIYSNYDWDVILKKIPNKDKESIIHKAYTLGIKKENYFWNDTEIEVAINMYLNNKSYREINEHLGNKFTEASIATKLYKLGIMKSNKWTNDELDILIEYYEENPEYVYENIDRDITNIQQKANKIGLLHPSIWRDNQDDYIKNNYKTMNDYEMAENLGRTRRSVKWRRNKLGLESHFHNHFGNISIANDGSVCLSIDEAIIHNFLLEFNVDIKKEYYYKDVILGDNSNRRFDWNITDINGNSWFVEYFGLYNSKRKDNLAINEYRKSTHKKIKDIYKADIIDQCIFIFPNDLKNKTLDEVFGKYIDLDKIKQLNAS